MLFRTLAALALSAVAVPAVQAQPARLTDPELASIRGGMLTDNSPTNRRLARDTGLRDFSIPGSLAVQQVDNWMNDVGYLMIAANIYAAR